MTAGDARKSRLVRVAGVKRPVPWYERAQRDDTQAANDEPYISLIAAWARPVAASVFDQTASEAAM